MVTTSQILFGLGVFVFVGSNTSFLLSGWLDDFNKLPPKTGIFIIDLLLQFFPELLKTPSSRVVFDLITGIAVSASTAVVYEGSRRRGPKGGFSQLLLGSYWTIAQFVAIGFATPLFLGLFLRKEIRDSADYVHVGSFRVYGVLLALVGTSIMTQALEPGMLKGDTDTQLLTAWLLYPVICVSFAVLLDRSKGSKLAFPRFVQDVPYLMGFAVGAISHFRTLKVVAVDGQFNWNDIASNPCAVFLLFDVFGLLAASYIWMQEDGRVSVFSHLWIAAIFGPSAHFSVLCALRDRAIDDTIVSANRSTAAINGPGTGDNKKST